MKVFIVFISCFLLFSNKKVVFGLNEDTTLAISTPTDVESFTETDSTIRSELKDTTAEFPVDFSTATTLQCPVPDPPTIFYKEYKIYWDIKNSSDDTCSINEIHLKCTSSNNTINENVESTEKYIDTNDETLGFQKGVVYNCTASVSTKFNVSDESNLLLIPPGSRVISTVEYESGVIEWSRPFENVSLIYELVIDSWKPYHDIPSGCKLPETIRSNSTEPYFHLTTIPADFAFKITISTTFWQMSVKTTADLGIPSEAPGIPTDISVQDFYDNVTIVSYILNWNTPCDSNGNLIGYRIILSVDNIINLNKTIQNKNSYKLPELIPNKNYQVLLYAVGSNTLISEPANYSFSTNDGIPTAPIYGNITADATFITITWFAPRNFTDGRITEITGYKITVTSTGPDYVQPNNCEQPVPLNINLDGITLSYNFTDARPKYNYEISLVASTGAGDGPAASFNITTKSAEPAAPENVTIIEIDESTNNISATLTWDAPCRMNGIIKNYKIIQTESYTEDPTSITSREITSNETNILLYLQPSHNYIFEVAVELFDYGGSGVSSYQNYTTQVGIPGLPLIEDGETLNSTNIIIRWQQPREKVGRIVSYYLHVTSIEPLYVIPTDCQTISYERTTKIEDTYEYNVGDLQPYTSHEIQLKASTSRGNGSYTTKYISTLQTVPENVRDVSNFSIENALTDEYDAQATVTFSTPCYTYGTNVSYTLRCDGRREGYRNQDISKTIVQPTETYTNFRIDLRPEHSYTCRIITDNGYAQNYTTLQNFSSPPGVPNFEVNFEKNINVQKRPHEAIITLKKSYLNMTQGNIKHIAVILSTVTSTNATIGEWDNIHWPPFQGLSHQIISDPFQNSNETTFVIGNGTTGNPRLTENTQYYLIIRIFTSSFYRDSMSLSFITDKINRIGTIIGVVMALLMVVVLGGAAFYIWKKGIYKKFPIIYQRKSSVKPASTTAVPIKKFVQYAKTCENKPEILKQQFSLLSTASEEIEQLRSSVFATLPENKRKNRYINISPFDGARVKLMIDEDDEIGSDYINASYIKGYSDRVEYIATQGPLPSTNRDFWRMVIQENVTIIVMVANFVENTKEKCHKYFPQNHENLIVGDNIEIRCATELHFGTYVIRNLLVRKDCMQTTVTHMQFLEWPDFKVPAGTEHMLQFCYQLRERVKLEGGVIIVHCSAGVGRTGTLIAADILLQTVNAGRQIDIYNTVLNLRKQRVKMVQSEEQYIYIHRLVADHIDRPRTPDSMDGTEHIYENTDIIKKPKTEESERSAENESQF